MKSQTWKINTSFNYFCWVLIVQFAFDMLFIGDNEYTTTRPKRVYGFRKIRRKKFNFGLFTKHKETKLFKLILLESSLN